jgi:hypothetical protein
MEEEKQCCTADADPYPDPAFYGNEKYGSESGSGPKSRNFDSQIKYNFTVQFECHFFLFLKVHKNENFFDSDFGICVISLLFLCFFVISKSKPKKISILCTFNPICIYLSSVSTKDLQAIEKQLFEKLRFFGAYTYKNLYNFILKSAKLKGALDLPLDILKPCTAQYRQVGRIGSCVPKLN